jgi:hypothetical protein
VRSVEIAVCAEDVERQGIAFQPPDFGHAEGGVNAQPVERAMAHVHLDGEVRRRIGAQVQPPSASHPGGIGDPETFVRLDPTLAPAPPHRHRTALLQRQSQLLRKGGNQAAKKSAVVIVLKERRHDFQLAAVVGQPDARSFRKSPQQPPVSLPVDP